MSACASPSKAEREVEALPKPAPIACVPALDGEIHKVFVRLGDRSPDRSAAFSVVFPSSREEYVKMNKMGILAISVLSKDEKDVPISKVTAIEDKKGALVHVLPSIFPRNPVMAFEGDHPAVKKFGRYRQDLYLFFPARLARAKGEIAVRLKNGVTSLPIGRLPLAGLPSFLVDDPDPNENPSLLPDAQVVTELLKKHFCF